MELSIIIVNYNSLDLLINCLNSIFKQPSRIISEIIVVDNFSMDDSKNKILEQFPQMKWIQMEYNSGFARANNEGIRKSVAATVLLLNADTIIENNAIEHCYLLFAGSDNVACGVQLLNPEGTPQISGNYVMKGGLNYLLPLPYLGTVFKSIASLFKIRKPNVPEAKGLVEVDWINGAFLMVKRSAIDTAGLLDEDFFLYAEEAEWCSRLQRVGKLCIYGDIKIIHVQGETANETFGSSGKGYKSLFDKKGLQIMLSNLVRIRKQFGLSWFFLIVCIYLFEIPVFFFGCMVLNVIGDTKYSFKEVKGYAFNMMRILGFLPRIVANKPFFYKT
ncbi:MAG: glycosyltransferase family 2 protein [Ginsengibacter sp.]